MTVAVLNLGDTATGAKTAAALRDDLQAGASLVVLDQSLSAAAARGNGYEGSLNLTTQEARDLGAAIGCDFFIIGDARTVARSPSNNANYFESYASIFIVSARTGRLILWERLAERRDNGDDAEKTLLQTLTSAAARYQIAILRAAEDEAKERTANVESPPATIEVMSDDDNGKGDTREPRPYRRVKPAYAGAAAQAEIEATVDVLVDVDARGEISHLEIARWAGYGLDQSVIDTVKQMHFFPAMRDGAAIPMRVLLRYNFKQKPLEKPPTKPLKLPVRPSQAPVQENKMAVQPGQVMIQPSQVAVQPRQVTFQPSQVAVQPRQVTIQPRQVAIHPRQVAIQPSQVAVQPSQVAFQPRQVAVQPGQVAIQPRQVAVQPSQVAVQAASVACPRRGTN
ncbi:MAG TPA: TonB family protein [Pyrinomonadaceae bacterium]|nr:TonB family protein [Pyrinomonadaceae bacterium]